MNLVMIILIIKVSVLYFSYFIFVVNLFIQSSITSFIVSV